MDDNCRITSASCHQIVSLMTRLIHTCVGKGSGKGGQLRVKNIVFEVGHSDHIEGEEFGGPAPRERQPADIPRSRSSTTTGHSPNRRTSRVPTAQQQPRSVPQRQHHPPTSTTRHASATPDPRQNWASGLQLFANPRSTTRRAAVTRDPRLNYGAVRRLSTMNHSPNLPLRGAPAGQIAQQQESGAPQVLLHHPTTTRSHSPTSPALGALAHAAYLDPLADAAVLDPPNPLPQPAQAPSQPEIAPTEAVGGPDPHSTRGRRNEDITYFYPPAQETPPPQPSRQGRKRGRPRKTAPSQHVPVSSWTPAASSSTPLPIQW
ncbi:hypothetical protein MMC30_005271 [Trapelia coarctata]|nr:hypothetical protein [Trapelia coarctata]